MDRNMRRTERVWRQQYPPIYARWCVTQPIVRQHYQPDRRIRARHTVVTNQLRVRQIGYIPTDLPDLYRIQGQHLLGTKQNKCMLVLKDDGNLYHYQQENQKFLQLNISSMDFNKVLSMTIDSNNLLWIFATGNNTRCYRLNHTGKAWHWFRKSHLDITAWSMPSSEKIQPTSLMKPMPSTNIVSATDSVTTLPTWKTK